MSLLAERRERSVDAILDQEYEALKPSVLRSVRGQLLRSNVHFPDDDLDAFYNQAWHGLYTAIMDGERIDNRGGWLVKVSYRRAIDEFRVLHPDRRAEGVEVDDRGEELDLEGRMDMRNTVHALMEAMRERLTKRECEATALCYLHGYTHPEAAEVMGIAPKRVEHIIAGARKKLGDVVRQIEAGKWCETRRSLMKAYALGVLDPDGERHGLAVSHLRECQACRAYVLRLRGLAAVVPPVVLPAGAFGGGGGVIGALHDLFHHASRLVGGSTSGGRAATKVGAGTTAAGATAATVAGGGGIGAKLAAGIVIAAVTAGAGTLGVRAITDATRHQHHQVASTHRDSSAALNSSPSSVLPAYTPSLPQPQPQPQRRTRSKPKTRTRKRHLAAVPVQGPTSPAPALAPVSPAAPAPSSGTSSGREFSFEK